MLNTVKPSIEELWFKQQMMADEETMAYNHAWGGTIPFPKEQWQNWYDAWMTGDESQHYYRYLQDESGNFVGEIAYHFVKEYDGFVADIIIHSKYRRKGYGSQGLTLLCAAAKQHGITELYDDLAIDNPSVNLFLKHGFSEVYRTNEIILVKKDLS
ncbi:GNAT family N-acetyltransferase [Tuanshanicoccus lijuaniae]|uniref:GNAT family N-acetyltransferase n=1 Tax=Aerococcaceae bacterium zg-1292 TaxID=2774330 RepID=UPI001937055F|nr:GNAT family N-acetyltransferase [Aerococcaceae bacterium zg-1292]QQA36305.1 GNAT family N-acetyltransferase [Aerococcaceae bacterium zg-1292]